MSGLSVDRCTRRPVTLRNCRASCGLSSSRRGVSQVDLDAGNVHPLACGSRVSIQQNFDMTWACFVLPTARSPSDALVECALPVLNM